MREAAKLSAFILLIIGTVGLLINEFVFHWGTPATIIFAVFNFVGLTILAYVNWGMKDKR
ncbi:hypothetical protein ACFLTP_05770 [Chloroflexota bacterium]